MTATRAAQRGLVFYEASHRYKLDGRWVPGVTTIIAVVDKPAIPKWAAGQVAEYVADNPDAVESLRDMGRMPMVHALKNIPWAKRDTAAVRGTEVHAIAERVVGGEEVDVPEALAGYVESAIDFMVDYAIRPVLVEAVVGSRRHQYAGKLDLIADSDRGPRAIYDYKTTRSGIYGATAWQNAAYVYADFHGAEETPMDSYGVEASYGVHLRQDGYDVYPLEFGPHVFLEFLHIREVYDANKRAVGDWRIPGSGYVGISEQQSEGVAS